MPQRGTLSKIVKYRAEFSVALQAASEFVKHCRLRAIRQGARSNSTVD